ENFAGPLLGLGFLIAGLGLGLANLVFHLLAAVSVTGDGPENEGQREAEDGGLGLHGGHSFACPPGVSGSAHGRRGAADIGMPMPANGPRRTRVPGGTRPDRPSEKNGCQAATDPRGDWESQDTADPQLRIGNRRVQAPSNRPKPTGPACTSPFPI